MSKGFEGRVYLFDYERLTYSRRMPVRYVKHPKASLCVLCGLPATEDNPLENCHKIPFGVGIREFGLTPDFLDSKANIVTAHKRTCNKAVELSEEAIKTYLAQLA